MGHHDKDEKKSDVQNLRELQEEDTSGGPQHEPEHGGVRASGGEQGTTGQEGKAGQNTQNAYH